MVLPDTAGSNISSRSSNITESKYYPKQFTLILYFLFAANTVVPLLDVPLLGLSVTAVFFALITLEVVFRSGYLSLRQQAKWILIITGIEFGIILSIFGNGLFGILVIDISEYVGIVQAGYWLLVCLITMALVSNFQSQHIRMLIMILGISVMILGALRLYEAIAFNRIGSGTSRIFSQNTYGILFSTFAPFSVITLFMQKTTHRWLFAGGIVILLLGIGVNGSRSSWVVSAIGIGVFSLLLIITQKRAIFSITSLAAIAFLIGVSIFSYLPANVLEPISARFATLERYEEDKSYLTRVLMQQKALILFEKSPILGVGRGQFRESSVEFDFSGTPFQPNLGINFNRIASHNSYAQFLAEQGLVGSVPLVILLILLSIYGLKAAVRLGSKGETWAIAIFASFISMSVHMWNIDNLQTSGSWFVYGLVAGMIEYERRHQNLVL